MFVECNITKIPTTVCKVGNIVVVTVSGVIKQALGAWGTLELSTTVPKANNRYNSHLFSQDTTDPRILLSVTGTHLFIESKGAGINNGIWTFGQLVYACEQHSVSPAGFTCLQGSIASGTYCAYTRIGHLICVFMNDMPSLGTKGVLPEGYRPPTDIIGFGYIRGTNTSGQILVNSAGEVATWCNQNNTRYFSGSVCFVVEQHSVSQNGDWTIFNFGTGYALSTRKVYKTISATAPYGSLYFCSYRFNSPDIYDSILYADVNPVTGNGLWLGHYREINDTTTVICYLSSTTSMSNVGMYVQETVIGKLKQHSVSQWCLIAHNSGTSYAPYSADDLSKYKMVSLVAATKDYRPLASTVFTIDFLTMYCTSADKAAECIYAPEPNAYTANVYYQNSKIYIKSTSTWDTALLIAF